MQADPTALVSIILPVYNAEKFLGEAIQSILDQSYPHWELLLIDDGSTDQSLSIAQSYKDNRIKIHFHTQNQGITASLNEGIALAQGAYIARMDADDIALPHRLEKQLRFMEQHPQIGLLGSQIQIINEDGHRTYRERPHPYSHEQIQLRSLFFCSFYHPTVFVRSELLKNTPYSHDVKAEDYHLWVRLITKTQCANLPEALLQLRRHGNNISKTQQQEYLLGISPIYQLAFEGIGRTLTPKELALLQSINDYGSKPLSRQALEFLKAFLNNLETSLIEELKFKEEDIRKIWGEVWRYAFIRSGSWSPRLWKQWLSSKRSYQDHFLKSSMRMVYRAIKSLLS